MERRFRTPTRGIERYRSDDSSIDLVVTDPPYGMEYRSNRRAKRFDSIAGDDDLSFFDRYVDGCFRILKPDTAIRNVLLVA